MHEYCVALLVIPILYLSILSHPHVIIPIQWWTIKYAGILWWRHRRRGMFIRMITHQKRLYGCQNAFFLRRWEILKLGKNCLLIMDRHMSTNISSSNSQYASEHTIQKIRAVHAKYSYMMHSEAYTRRKRAISSVSISSLSVIRANTHSSVCRIWAIICWRHVFRTIDLICTGCSASCLYASHTWLLLLFRRSLKLWNVLLRFTC